MLEEMMRYVNISILRCNFILNLIVLPLLLGIILYRIIRTTFELRRKLNHSTYTKLEIYNNIITF